MLLREQNAYLDNYADFHIGGILEKMLHFKISRTTVKDNILMPPYIVNIHKTTYTESKGIGTMELTVEDLHKALADVKHLSRCYQKC